MTTTQMKRAIWAAEKANASWNGMGEIPYSYESLCEMRCELTLQLTIESAENNYKKREAAWQVKRTQEVRIAWERRALEAP